MVKAIKDRISFLQWAFMFIIVLVILSICAMFSPTWAWQQWFKSLFAANERLRRKTWTQSMNN